VMIPLLRARYSPRAERVDRDQTRCTAGGLRQFGDHGQHTPSMTASPSNFWTGLISLTASPS
jgi:hypothetical protein